MQRKHREAIFIFIGGAVIGFLLGWYFGSRSQNHKNSPTYTHHVPTLDLTNDGNSDPLNQIIVGQRFTLKLSISEGTGSINTYLQIYREDEPNGTLTLLNPGDASITIDNIGLAPGKPILIDAGPSKPPVQTKITINNNALKKKFLIFRAYSDTDVTSTQAMPVSPF